MNTMIPIWPGYHTVDLPDRHKRISAKIAGLAGVGESTVVFYGSAAYGWALNRSINDFDAMVDANNAARSFDETLERVASQDIPGVALNTKVDPIVYVRGPRSQVRLIMTIEDEPVSVDLVYLEDRPFDVARISNLSLIGLTAMASSVNLAHIQPDMVSDYQKRTISLRPRLYAGIKARKKALKKMYGMREEKFPDYEVLYTEPSPRQIHRAHQKRFKRRRAYQPG